MDLTLEHPNDPAFTAPVNIAAEQVELLDWVAHANHWRAVVMIKRDGGTIIFTFGENYPPTQIRVENTRLMKVHKRA